MNLDPYLGKHCHSKTLMRTIVADNIIDQVPPKDIFRSLIMLAMASAVDPVFDKLGSEQAAAKLGITKEIINYPDLLNNVLPRFPILLKLSNKELLSIL